MPQAPRNCNTSTLQLFTCNLHHDSSNLEKKVKCCCMVRVAVCTMQLNATCCFKLQMLQPKPTYEYTYRKKLQIGLATPSYL
jgi:hypothetical protein